MADYDIEAAFSAIEDELIESMMRNMKRHRLEEITEDKQWEMWQAMQLEALERYKKENRKKFSGRFSDINDQIDDLLREANKRGSMNQEVKILQAIKNGFSGFRQASDAMQGEFFKLNERKLDALIKATTDDMKKAEVAILRMADDQYRKAIFNAQMYANTGAGTYEKAVDMAAKDMCSSGLNCVEYANGARHTLADYADMAIRTAAKRAYLQGEGTMRQNWGITTVIVNKRGNPCPKCLPFCGKVFIDDVWSGGSSNEISPVTGLKYPLISTAVKAGLYHPRCRDSHTTYFEGVSTPPDGKYTRDELDKIAQKYQVQQKKQYAERQVEKFERLAKYSLDNDNKKRYQARADEWKHARFRTGGMDSGEYADSKKPLVNFRAISQDRGVDVLRKESEEWIEQLTEQEIHAIKKYTYNSGDKKPERFFERLNAMLRGDIPENSTLKKYSYVISGALRKSTIKHDVICYRSLDKDVYIDKNKGSIFREKQFISTSVKKSGALDKPFKVIIYVKKGTKAGYIEKISCYEKQRELLLDKDTLFRVISKKENMIELEVL